MTGKSRIDQLSAGFVGATVDEDEADALRNMIRDRTRTKYTNEYLLALARELMPDSVLIEWARAHLAKLDTA